VLRPGDAAASRGAVGILDRLITRLRQAFPKATIRVRLDGGFAAPEVLDFLDEQEDLEYTVNMASNKILKRRVKPAMRSARKMSKEAGRPSMSTESSTTRPRRLGRRSGASSTRQKWFAIHHRRSSFQKQLL
jgi:Transposase DDE domain group 1